MQHLPLVAAALARSAVLSPAVVPIDVDNVPAVEIKPDVKPKKPKAPAADGAAPAPGAAAEGKKDKAAAVKQAPVDKVVSDKKKGEQAAAAKDGGAGKKGDKKDKPAKEKKPAPPAPVAEAPAPWMIDLRVGKIVEGASSFPFPSLPLRLTRLEREN